MSWVWQIAWNFTSTKSCFYFSATFGDCLELPIYKWCTGITSSCTMMAVLLNVCDQKTSSVSQSSPSLSFRQSSRTSRFRSRSWGKHAPCAIYFLPQFFSRRARTPAPDEEGSVEFAPVALLMPLILPSDIFILDYACRSTFNQTHWHCSRTPQTEEGRLQNGGLFCLTLSNGSCGQEDLPVRTSGSS